MWANDEMGVQFPVEGIAEICRSRGGGFAAGWRAAPNFTPPNQSLNFSRLRASEAAGHP